MTGPEKAKLPRVSAFVGPILRALRDGGGRASVAQMLSAAVEDLGLSEADLAIVHDEERGQRSEVSYRMAWARTQLRESGRIQRASRGEWLINDEK